MKICNCQRKCFDYIEKFGFYKGELPPTSAFADLGTGVPKSVDQIRIRSLSHGMSFFSYDLKTNQGYHVSLKSDVPAFHSLCEEGTQRLIDICLWANQNMNINADTPHSFHSMEEFLSIVRNKKLELLSI